MIVSNRLFNAAFLLQLLILLKAGAIDVKYAGAYYCGNVLIYLTI